jgi:transcriptional regulator with XRE-family HTH domain
MQEAILKIARLWRTLFAMAPKESEKLIAGLKAWADAEYGRRAELARMLGVSRQLVSDWLAGRKMPTLDAGLRIQAFLKKHRRSRS